MTKVQPQMRTDVRNGTQKDLASKLPYGFEEAVSADGTHYYLECVLDSRLDNNCYRLNHFKFQSPAPDHVLGRPKCTQPYVPVNC